MNLAPVSPQTILLVDDNPHGLVARKQLLSEQGHQVVSALSGEEALGLFAKQDFGLVVTDFKMSGMDGVALIAKLHQLKPEVKTILLSGFVDVLGMTEENTGADAVLNKDSGELPNLLRAVKRLAKSPAGIRRKQAASQKRALAARRA
jgi:CheY-like chemotaxis protein